MTRFTLPAAALLSAVASAAYAAASDEAIAACRAIQDAGRRLACYDALPIAAPGAARAPVSPSATAPGPAAPSQSAAQAEASRFGLPATTQPAPIDSVESHIEGHFAGWYAGTRIRLANGQVWQVTDGTSRFANLDNPKVTVRRGALGSFFLDIDGVNPSPRVRRIE